MANVNRNAWMAKFRKEQQKSKRTVPRRPRNVVNGFDLDVVLFCVRKPPSKKADTGKKAQASVQVRGVGKLVASARALAADGNDEALAALPYEVVDSTTVRVTRTAPAKQPEDETVKKAVVLADVLGVACSDPPSKFLLRDGLQLNVTYFSNSVEEDFAIAPYQLATLNGFHFNAYWKTTDSEWMVTEQCAGLLFPSDALNQRAPEERVRALVDFQTQAFRDPLEWQPAVPWRPQFLTLRLGRWSDDALFPEPRANQHLLMHANRFMYTDTGTGAHYEDETGLTPDMFTYKSNQDATAGQLFPVHRQLVNLEQWDLDADGEPGDKTEAAHRFYLYSRTCRQSGLHETDTWKAHEMTAPMPFYATFEVGTKKNKKTNDLETTFYPVASAWPVRAHLHAHGVRVSAAWAQAHFASDGAPPPVEDNAVNAVPEDAAFLRNVSDLEPAARDLLLAKCSDAPASTAPASDRWELYALATRVKYDRKTQTEIVTPIAPADVVGQPDAPLAADSTALPAAPATTDDVYTVLAVRAQPPVSAALPAPSQITPQLVPEDLLPLGDAPALDAAALASVPAAPPLDEPATGGGMKRARPADDPVAAEPDAAAAPSPVKKAKKSKGKRK